MFPVIIVGIFASMGMLLGRSASVSDLNVQLSFLSRSKLDQL